jgi:surface antigen
MRVPVVIALLAGVSIAGCSAGSGITTGTVPGANTGRIVASPVATGAGQAPIGAVEGGVMGADIGRSLNDSDRAVALKAEYEALEYGRSGHSMQWRSNTDDVNGTIRVGGIYQVNSLDCREYTHDIAIGGRTRVVKGTACRRPDGVWRVIR